MMEKDKRTARQDYRGDIDGYLVEHRSRNVRPSVELHSMMACRGTIRSNL